MRSSSSTYRSPLAPAASAAASTGRGEALRDPDTVGRCASGSILEITFFNGSLIETLREIPLAPEMMSVYVEMCVCVCVSDPVVP